MRIDLSDPIPLSADEAFLLLRDDMPSLVPYLGDCEPITVTISEGRVDLTVDVALNVGEASRVEAHNPQRLVLFVLLLSSRTER